MIIFQKSLIKLTYKIYFQLLDLYIYISRLCFFRLLPVITSNFLGDKISLYLYLSIIQNIIQNLQKNRVILFSFFS